jgi:hypothetical protein
MLIENDRTSRWNPLCLLKYYTYHSLCTLNNDVEYSLKTHHEESGNANGHDQFFAMESMHLRE